MNRVSTCIVASVLALSTICGTVCLRFDGDLLSAITDQAEENEQEIEAFDFRQLIDQSGERLGPQRSHNSEGCCYSENLNFRNFIEVPLPPPKG